MGSHARGDLPGNLPVALRWRCSLRRGGRELGSHGQSLPKLLSLRPCSWGRERPPPPLPPLFSAGLCLPLLERRETPGRAFRGAAERGGADPWGEDCRCTLRSQCTTLPCSCWECSYLLNTGSEPFSFPRKGLRAVPGSTVCGFFPVTSLTLGRESLRSLSQRAESDFRASPGRRN